MSMKRMDPKTLLLVAAVLLLGFVPGALAKSKKNALLRGDYAITQLSICMSSAMLMVGAEETFDPVDPVGMPLLGDAQSSTIAVTGVSRFDGKGNWELVDGRSFVVDQGPASAGTSPMRAGDFTCKGSYTVRKDRSFTVQGNCTLAAGLHFDPISIDGHVSKDRETLILVTTAPKVEQITFGPGGPKLGERMCSAMAVDIRLVGKK